MPAMRIGNMTLYGMSDVAKGYNVYLTNDMAGTRSALKNKEHVKVAQTIGKARKEALALLKGSRYKYAVIYKGLDERAQGCMYFDGKIPCWINEQYNYIVNPDGSIRNGVRYR